MELQLANYLKDRVFADIEDEITVHDNYIGRGKVSTTPAIEVPTIEVFFEGVGTFMEEFDETFDKDADFIRALGTLLRTIHWDDIGRNIVVY